MRNTNGSHPKLFRIRLILFILGIVVALMATEVSDKQPCRYRVNLGYAPEPRHVDRVMSSNSAHVITRKWAGNTSERDLDACSQTLMVEREDELRLNGTAPGNTGFRRRGWR